MLRSGYHIFSLETVADLQVDPNTPPEAALPEPLEQARASRARLLACLQGAPLLASQSLGPCRPACCLFPARPPPVSCAQVTEGALRLDIEDAWQMAQRTLGCMNMSDFTSLPDKGVGMFRESCCGFSEGALAACLRRLLRPAGLLLSFLLSAWRLPAGRRAQAKPARAVHLRACHHLTARPRLLPACLQTAGRFPRGCTRTRIA